MKRSSKEPDRVIEIFSGTVWEAEMIKSLLGNASIHSFLRNNVLNTHFYEPIIADGVKVMILESNYEEAKSIVDEYYRNLSKESI